MKTSLIFLLICCSLSLKQFPINSNPKYEFSYPLRFLFHRMATKIQLNPILAHLANYPSNSESSENEKNGCSSRTGPFCHPVNMEYIQDYRIDLNNLQKKTRLSYLTQRAYLKQRQLLARQIETGEVSNFFMIASEDYRTIDKIIKSQLKNIFWQGQINIPKQATLNEAEVREEGELSLDELNMEDAVQLLKRFAQLLGQNQ